MDRQIVYPGAIPLETDLLNTNKYAMIGLAKLASALLGSNTYVHGLSCTASSPASMVINVAAGQIYSLQNIDGTAYSSLAADTTHTILKQGLILDATQFTLTAPGTSGYSINYLIQVTYTDTDSGATVLPYYNASNPSVAWSGPNNSGTAQNTVRSGVCTVALKAGVAATTGTQTTPSPDSGYTGLYVITVAQGATTVTAANISVYPNAPILNQAGIYDSFQRNTAVYGADTGSANAYLVNINPKIISLTDGTEVIFKATNANTASSTLNVCALGAFPVISQSGATLIANEIVANSLVKVRWSSASTSWVLIDATGTFQTAQTAPVGTSTTQIATTQFVSQVQGKLLATRSWTVTSTYTPTPGTTQVEIWLVGGGGGSGGAAATGSGQFSAGGGGIAGAFAYTGLIAVPASGTIITVGSGGVGATAGNNNGSPGGVSSVGSIISCPGGGGGAGGGASSYSNTVARIGDPSAAPTGATFLTVRGAPATNVVGFSSGLIKGGDGGASFFGTGGAGGHSVTNSAGAPGLNYGSGGGGPAIGQNGAAQSGANGFGGIVIIKEYS